MAIASNSQNTGSTLTRHSRGVRLPNGSFSRRALALRSQGCSLFEFGGTDTLSRLIGMSLAAELGVRQRPHIVRVVAQLRPGCRWLGCVDKLVVIAHRELRGRIFVHDDGCVQMQLQPA